PIGPNLQTRPVGVKSSVLKAGLVRALKMKSTPLFLIFICLCGALRSEQRIDPKSTVGADNYYTDSKYGVRVKVPVGWELARGIRWGPGERENTITFRPTMPSPARPNMYYAMFHSGMPAPAADEVNPWFRMMAAKKEESRQKGGELFPDYTNNIDSLDITQIAGRPAMIYTASFKIKNDQPMLEHFLWVLGEKSFVMFFTRGFPKNVQAIIPKIKEMASSLTIP
ncbi:MAG: hypothetical protein ABIR80_03545, partial [Opitutaceae bacterium]